jgi:threonine/homoserine/homoserine lactone efflux protein
MTSGSSWISLLRGVVLGFSIAAPVGPIGVLCIKRTLADGRWVGLATGIGAAFADGLYGALAAGGLSWLTDGRIGQKLWIQLVGGLFLLYLGVSTFLARPAERPASFRGAGLLGAFASAFLLTLTNPMTILSFVAVFAGMGLGAGERGAVALVVGVVLGSAVWWLTLSAVVGSLRNRFDTRALVWVNRVSGLVIAAFGVTTLVSLRGEAF